MAGKSLRLGLTQLGMMTGHPIAFLILGVYAAVWVLFGGDKLDFHAGATLATWLMTLFIQRAEHRDTQAIHAKLDELLRAHGEARSDLTHLDQQPAEEIEQHRAREQARDGSVH